MLGASCFFYGWWDERFVVLLAGSILANHHLGDWVGDAMGPDGNPTPRSKALVRVGVVGTLRDALEAAATAGGEAGDVLSDATEQVQATAARAADQVREAAASH